VFDLRVTHVGFVVNKTTAELVIFRVILFLYQLSFYKFSIITYRLGWYN
jgi:hypothetical protein